MAKRAIWGALVVLLVIAAAYASFFIAPTENSMGEIQRIFYLHAASGWAGMTAFFVCFVANICYVLRRKQKYDWIAVSAAEVGLAFTTVLLITGPIWAHPVWGIWWTWDARLTSTFILWMLYIAYLLLRGMVEEPDRRALLSAVFGIFAFIDVPLVFGAIRWWRTQHPQPVIMGGPGSGLEPTMRNVFFFSVLAMHALMVLLLSERYRLEKTRDEFLEVQREAEAG
jgi:heme exporter protein C